MSTNLDGDRVQAFAGQLLGDLGAALSAALIHLGDRLGLYRALADGGPMTSMELAKRTGTTERYVREWLCNQAASGYVSYDAARATYTLPPEHAAVLADEQSPAFMAGGFGSAVALFKIIDRTETVFRTGEGIGWHEHDAGLFCGTERFFGPAYRTHLIDSWIPALDGVREQLEAGGRIADVGCGHGASTLLMARAFPRCEVVGFDAHDASVATAAERAAAAGLQDRVRFECAPADRFPGRDYRLITFFDCLHDMGDPEAAARHAREHLAPGGTLMLVEPFAEDRVEDNLNVVGRAYYGFSTMVCTPASMAQPGRRALGAQAGEARLRDVLRSAGFSHVRRATATPFNLVIEARA